MPGELPDDWRYVPTSVQQIAAASGHELLTLCGLKEAIGYCAVEVRHQQSIEL